MGRIQNCSGKGIGGNPILIDTLAIQEAVLVIILKKLSDVIIQSESYNVVEPLREILRRQTIYQALLRTLLFAKTIRNINFMYL